MQDELRIKRRLILHASIVASFALAIASPVAHAESAENDRTILFVDNQDILYYAGLERKIRPLTRHKSNPLIASDDKPWEKFVAYNTVYRNPESGRFQMWYQSYVGGDAPHPSLRCVVAYAESDDGIAWTKPEFDQFPYGDVEKTNIVLLSNEGPSTHYGASVVVNPDESDASRRYKMAYWDFVKDGDGYAKGMCVAFSPDGIHWTKFSGNPVLHGPHGARAQPPVRGVGDAAGPPLAEAVSDVIDATYDPRRKKYVVYTKTWIDGPKGMLFWKRAVVRSESDDFVRWSRPELVMWPDEMDDGTTIRNTVSSDRPPISDDWREKVNGAQLHGGPAFYYNDRYFSLLQVLDLDVSGLMPIELAISQDGFDWKRPFRKDFFLPVNGGNEFDSGTIWSNATPILHNDEMWFYYGSYIAWHLSRPAYESKRFSGIGVATMPRDRFAGLRPIDQFGQVTVKPIALQSYSSMTLNADATSGSIRVELLDEAGYRVAGYTADDAETLSGDCLRHEIRWTDSSMSDVPDEPISIRIHLDNATAYAVTLR